MTKSQRHLLLHLRRHWRQIELSEGEVGQRLGACSLSPVGELKADGREETLHSRRSGWDAVVLPSHTSQVGEVLDVIYPPIDTIPGRISDISHTSDVTLYRGDTLGLGRYLYIYGWGHHYPSAVKYQHVRAITTQEHSRHSAPPPFVLNLRHGQVLVKLVFPSITIRHVGAAREWWVIVSVILRVRPCEEVGKWDGLSFLLPGHSGATRKVARSVYGRPQSRCLRSPQHLAQHFTHAHGLQFCPPLNARRRRSAQLGIGAPQARIFR